MNSVNSIHHVHFVVSNAMQASFWYCCCMGFERFAKRRTKTTMSFALRNGNAILLLSSPTAPVDQLNNDIARHGDFVQDVAFEVDDVSLILENVKRNGLKVLKEPETNKDEFGSIIIAKIFGSAGSIVHTLIQRCNYNGIFLPGYSPIEPIGFCSLQSRIPVSGIDHVVENHSEGTLDNITDWYERVFQMQRFWSIDDTVVHTEYSALKAYLVSNQRKNIQITLAEPVPVSKRSRSQLQEFLDFHTSPGIQHIAFTVNDIVGAVAEMKRRSVEFLTFPATYYEDLRKRLQSTNLQIKEDLALIEKYGILMDFDSNGYLLQIFTKPVQSRPTFFIEIIQRHNFQGFGANNFKALFKAVEIEQMARNGLHTE
ncbi:Glyoxalase bleomycin resistance protein dioxygenase domain containing protein [Aphelenchoides bicaudatus]|nr:Glyoxalase bleomycin resistance protein dioxygenase domain containing protein [Aphelenchoides bicaudatus]